ncbi:cell division protein FtsQ/DivIB [Ancylomarina sp. 16SWW S1-10-2]|uniref:cell division protein FtsQ/DivIB n=1 Tax=Ancylomarina sp. 16SWW S1-10-2 TaxID=2499681 RepID=UPI0012AD5A63|nr:cell division protein FtsQ [Ancylomarina sp. 16SWW S1-10-2]MRT94188.1 cell division protein FtsQ [Ancylomarina sp. 16SWW S1-10-2]
MLKKIKPILVTLALLAYLIFTFAFVNRKSDAIMITGIDIDIIDSLNTRFICDSEIKNLVLKNHPNIIGTQAIKINKEHLEHTINKIPFVKNTEIYTTLKGCLHLNIEQRKPIVRILKGKGFYIDEEGKQMPLSSNYTSRVLVVSGHIKDKTIESDLMPLINFITKDEFWSSQINQIYVDSNNEYILIPRVGGQKIEMGKIDNYERKFLKLYALYKDGFSTVGWNKYKKINLKYENQVVCTKR